MYGKILALSLVLLMGTFLVVEPASAQNRERRVSFTLLVERPDEEIEDRERRVRVHQEMAREAASRIETRLDAVGGKDHRVRVNGQNEIEVTVYGGRHDAAAIKSAVIPRGQLEIRPVYLDQSIWYDVEEQLPGSVEIRQAPGSVSTDEIYLFSRDGRALREFVGRVAIAGVEMRVFPHGDGWRTVQLGDPMATERDLTRSDLGRTPSAIPYVTVEFEAEVAQELRATMAEEGLRQLAVVLDRELIAVQGFSARQFSETLTLDCPAFLRSHEARRHWALQVGGRLAAPIPITLVEAQEP